MNAPAALICPTVTPLSWDGGFNAKALRAHLERVAPYVDGVLVLGSSGEHPWLPDQDADRVVRTAAQLLRGTGTTVYAGAGQAGLARTLHTADRRAEHGAEVLVVTPPTYFPLSEGELADYFAAVAERAPLPVMLYNIPQFTGNAITPQLAVELAALPAVVGIKDSSGDFDRFSRLLELRGPGFSVMQGRDGLAAESLLNGATGLVAVLCNVAAPLLRRLCDSADAKDRDQALHWQRVLDRLAKLLEHGGLIAAVKAAMEGDGVAGGPPLAPVRAASPLQRSAIAHILADPEIRPLLNSAAPVSA